MLGAAVVVISQEHSEKVASPQRQLAEEDTLPQYLVMEGFLTMAVEVVPDQEAADGTQMGRQITGLQEEQCKVVQEAYLLILMWTVDSAVAELAITVVAVAEDTLVVEVDFILLVAVEVDRIILEQTQPALQRYNQEMV